MFYQKLGLFAFSARLPLNGLHGLPIDLVSRGVPFASSFLLLCGWAALAARMRSHNTTTGSSLGFWGTTLDHRTRLAQLYSFAVRGNRSGF